MTVLTSFSAKRFDVNALESYFRSVFFVFFVLFIAVKTDSKLTLPHYYLTYQDKI